MPTIPWEAQLPKLVQVSRQPRAKGAALLAAELPRDRLIKVWVILLLSVPPWFQSLPCFSS